MSGTVHIDFETRSRCDLPSCGAFRYGCDPTTEIFMAAVSEDALDAPIYLWINPKFRTADEMGENEQAEELLAKAKLLAAHNAPFELAMVWGAHQRGAASPFRTSPRVEQWRDTAAVARKAGLPSSLEKMADALGLEVRKNLQGKALIRFFCIPQKDGSFNQPKDHPEKWASFCNYCRVDVRVEKLGAHKLKAFELQGSALDTFLFDLRMNLRGIPVNVPALRNAQKIIQSVETEVVAEFRQLTNLNPTQREAVRQLVGLENMQAETVQAALDGVSCNPAPRERRILELYAKLSYAAVKKVETMLDWACPDGRVRGCHIYHGTGPGRWAGIGIQPQNFKKTPKWMRPITDQVYEAICKGANAERLEMLFGGPYEVISGCIRHFIHLPGTEILDADYSAIQARGICWLAGEHSIVRMWREGSDIYKFVGSHIYNVPIGQIDADQRDFAKRVVLGCGFQMGPAKFLATCEQYGVECDETLAKRGVEIYRELHPNVVKYWYFLDASVRSAIKNPGTPCGPFVVRRIAGLPYLLCTLPSGRAIAYPHPLIEKREPTQEEHERMAMGYSYSPDRFFQVTYWGQDPRSMQWIRIKLYGGKIAENCAMGVEADIMAHGLCTAEKRGFKSFAIVHDQALAEKGEGQTIEGFVAALTDLPAWARGFPIKAEGRERRWYSK